MNAQVPRQQVPFTVAGANRTLPLVRAIVADIVTLYNDVSERRERLQSLQKRRTRKPARTDDPYGEEVAAIESDLEKDADRLHDYVEELSKLGVELSDPADGIVDFPTVMDGTPAFLCWKLGEPEIAYWHQTDASASTRQPLPGGTGRATDNNAV